MLHLICGCKRITFSRAAAGAVAAVVLGAALAERLVAAPAGLQSADVRLQVPFYADKTDQCGPATLAGVLTFWGNPTDPRQLRQEMYLAKLRGTLPMDLVHVAETRGLSTEMVRGDLESLRSELRSGRPVLAMLDVGYTVMPMHHYVIVTGFNDEKQGLYTHSAGKADQFIPYGKFMRQWKRTDYWAMFARGQ